MVRSAASVVSLGCFASAWACGSSVIVSGGAGGGLAAASAVTVASASGNASSSSASSSSATGGACGNIGGGGPGQWDAVSAGSFHTCAIKLDHTLWCWGQNFAGQLGIGGASDAHTPSQVLTLGPGVAGVGAGALHTCAIKLDKNLWCWGSNAGGQLGDGSQIDKQTPAQVSVLGASVASVAAGSQHTCAIRIDGALWCWGYNGYGQLGDGSQIDQKVPEQVGALGTNVAEVAAGAHHTCARRIDGTLWCWGANGYGQLGDGTGKDKSLPAQVSALGVGVVGVAAGYDRTCARKADGSLWCWGKNDHGQLGNGSHVDGLMPSMVSALTANVTAVAVGQHHTCAVAAGSSWCWGYDSNGQCGDGYTPCCPDRLEPVEVCGLDIGAMTIAAGLSHSCAVKADHSMWCWGLNGNYELGDDTRTDRPTPVPIP